MKRNVLVMFMALCLSALAFSATQIPLSANDKLSLNFHDIPVRDLLELLAEYKQMNLIVSDQVQGNLTLRLENVYWQQALDAILMMKNLAKKQQDSILIIGPSNQLSGFSEQENSTENLTAHLITVHFAKASDIGDMIKNKSNDLLSPRGSVTVDPRTNRLWVKDTLDRLSQIQQFLTGVDVAARQVSIMARIVHVDQDSINDLGIKFGSVAHTDAQDDLHRDMPIGIDDPGHITFSLARLGPNNFLDLEIAALAQEGRAEVISKPELVTANRQPANIESGQEIPYQQGTSSGATNVSFKKAVLGLNVTPEITPENKILLTLKINQDQVSALTVNGVPAITTQKIETQILVNDNETIVLGGIFEETKNNTVQRLPFLGNMPVIGVLFSNKEIRHERKELLIFITPRILN